jgi:MFS family permease
MVEDSGLQDRELVGAPGAERHPFILLLIFTSTVLGIAGTDLVLPAVPSLPGLLSGTLEQAQLVLAAFTGGAAVGLLLFGELGARLDQRILLVGSLVAYGLISALCSLSTSLDELICLRLIQGAAGAAGAVFAPGMLRALYHDHRAVSALGLLGSIESLVPALAPVVGLWLFAAFGWKASFTTLAGIAAVVAVVMWFARASLPIPAVREVPGSYRQLFVSWPFMRQAISHAFTVGALLVFVFGAPAVITKALGGTLQNFIVLQISGITLFIIAANLAGALCRRFRAPAVIMTGTLMSAAGALVMFVYALAGGHNIIVITVIFTLLNSGLGVRGPPGFHAALLATNGDDARGAAFVAVSILLTTALGTAAVAPFIMHGLISVATAAVVLSLAAVSILLRP